MVNELEIDNMMFRNAIKYDSKLKSCTEKSKHLQTRAMKIKRLAKCKKIIALIKATSSIVTIFTAEKIFIVDAVLNRRNTRFIAEPKSDVKLWFRTKFSAHVMAFVVYATDVMAKPKKFCKTSNNYC